MMCVCLGLWLGHISGPLTPWFMVCSWLSLCWNNLTVNSPIWECCKSSNNPSGLLCQLILTPWWRLSAGGTYPRLEVLADLTQMGHHQQRNPLTWTANIFSVLVCACTIWITDPYFVRNWSHQDNIRGTPHLRLHRCPINSGALQYDVILLPVVSQLGLQRRPYQFPQPHLKLPDPR